MQDLLYGEDPEPAERVPAGPLYVPVRPGPTGCAARMFRTPLGERTAVAFTAETGLLATLGASQSWIRLGEPALRALVEPLGVTALTIDPPLSAPAASALPAASAPPASSAVPVAPSRPLRRDVTTS